MEENNTHYWKLDKFVTPFIAKKLNNNDAYYILIIDNDDQAAVNAFIQATDQDQIKGILSVNPIDFEMNLPIQRIASANDIPDLSHARLILCSYKAPAAFHSLLYPLLQTYFSDMMCLFNELKELKAFFEAYGAMNVFRPLDALYDSWMGNTIYGTQETYTKELLEGKSVIEIGPLDGGMTSAILHANPKKLLAVDIHWENYAKLSIAKRTFGFDNLELEIDDFHNISVENYGKWDVLFAHGILYHSSNPILAIEQLSKVANTIVVGTHTKMRKDHKSEIRKYSWRDEEYDFTSAAEHDATKGGPGFEQIFMKCEDYDKVFETLGFQVEKITTVTSKYDELFYVFIARKK